MFASCDVNQRETPEELKTNPPPPAVASKGGGPPLSSVLPQSPAAANSLVRPERSAATLTAALATRVKKVIADQGADTVRRHMARFYRVLRLMNDQGEWATPELAAIGERLLPGDLSLGRIDAFVDEIRRANERNECLMEFAGALQAQPLDEIISNLKRTEAAVVPEIVGFALVLQHLTAAFHGNVDLVDEIMDHWGQEGEKVNLHRGQGPDFRVKFESVRAILTKSRHYVRAGEVPDDFGNAMLPFNILQAAVADVLCGHFSNARAGWVLSRFRPGNDPGFGAGAGPVRLADGGRVIETGLPLAEQWVDLYQSWNLAFGSQFGSFPLYMCKLIIPQVAAYHDAPQHYIWNRVNALMIYLHFAAFATLDRKNGNAVDSVYHGKAWSAFTENGLTRLWGRVNRRCALAFRRRVASARRERDR
jgi:hypothetical protein